MATFPVATEYERSTGYEVGPFDLWKHSSGMGIGSAGLMG